MEENKYRKETKYFCTYCKTFVQNNKISKSSHEQGPGHKNAVSRFLRNVHKQQDRKQIQDKKNERMMLEIEEKAKRAMEGAVGSTSASASASVSAVGKSSHSQASRAQNTAAKSAISTGKINPDLYGYGVEEEGGQDLNPSVANFIPMPPFPLPTFLLPDNTENGSSMMASAAKIGEWETFYEPVHPQEDEDEDEKERDDTILPIKKGELNEFLDEEEGVTKADVTGFQIKQKRMLEVDEDEDADDAKEEIGFTKRKGKGNTRKKGIL